MFDPCAPSTCRASLRPVSGWGCEDLLLLWRRGAAFTPRVRRRVGWRCGVGGVDVVGSRSVGGKAYVHLSNGLCFYISFLRMGPKGNGAVVHAALGSIMGNNRVRHHFGVNRGLRSMHMRHHPCRCACRRNRRCRFVGRRAFSSVVVSGGLVGNISFVVRNRVIRIISSTSARAILFTSVPMGMRLGMACARPNVGNSATAGALGPTAMRSNTRMHIPLFVRRNRVVRVGARSNSCMKHVQWGV